MRIRALNNTLLLLLLALTSSAVTYLLGSLITDEMLATDLSAYFNQDQVEELIAKRTDLPWQVRLYVFRSVWLLLKVCVTYLVFKAGLFFFEVDARGVSLFRFVIIAWFVYLIPGVAKVCWFTFVDQHFTSAEVYRVSVYFPADRLLAQLQEPYAKVLKHFRVFNLTEVAFCLAVSYLVSAEGIPFKKSAKIVFSSNFVFLFVLSVFMAFMASLRL